ncbi:MAG TPA: hypothetical protein VEI01_11945, partial [Terriglobales bacterium]|nr:hypothetical protein [Terriglobales bacterium]
MKRFYRRKLIQKGMGKARIAVARKVGIRLWIMLRDQIDYAEFCRRGPMFGEGRVPTPLQDLQDHLLDQSIQGSRDTQLSYPAIRLGDFYPLYRLGFVGSAPELFPDFGPVLRQVV